MLLFSSLSVLDEMRMVSSYSSVSCDEFTLIIVGERESDRR